MDTSIVFIIIIGVIFGLGALLMPTWVAMLRGVLHTRKVLVWNVSTGWTPTGWAICLAMALSSNGGEWKNTAIAAVWFGSTSLLLFAAFIFSLSRIP